MNKKGFLQAYTLFLFFMILGMIQVLLARYTTIIQFHKTSKTAYFCELYVFHKITNKIENEATTEEEEQEVSALSETLHYEQCQMTLTYEKQQVFVQYQTEETQHGLRITLDDESKEILDVAYEY